jgi:hypothetical protein
LVEQALQLPQRDFGLGGELHLRRHAGCLAPLGVGRPFLRQVQLIGHGQAGLFIGHRDAHRHLAVVLLAQYPAVLPRHPHRVLALLRKARVVDDPVAAGREIHLRHHPLGDALEHLLIRPLGPGHEVMQRLVPGAGVLAVDAGRYRLHALARQRQHQPGAVALQPGVPVRMPESRRQVRQVSLKPLAPTHHSSQKGTKKCA